MAEKSILHAEKFCNISMPVVVFAFCCIFLCGRMIMWNITISPFYRDADLRKNFCFLQAVKFYNISLPVVVFEFLKCNIVAVFLWCWIVVQA